MLPLECKRPPPQWCEVYIPMLDLTVNLPLAHLQDSSSITLEEAKEAVVDILKEEQEESLEKITAKSSQALDDFGFCWTTGDRAEWIYWTHSATHQPMNSVICPQNIEKTHRLELRPIEHTPNHIVLPDNFVLKEPPPVEGFLIHITDFTGSNKTKKNRKMRYFASFDQYLFYTPVQKTTVPNMRCFIDEGLLPKNARSQPYVSAISPYAPACTPEIQAGEITRRMLLMTEAKGVIDLTQVSYVRRTFIDNPMTNFEESGISNHSRIALLNKQSSIPSYQAVSQQDSRKACLELVMENGLQIKFEAYSSDTCDLWVNYLAQIVVYWKARKEAVKDVHSYDNFIFNHAKSLVNTKDGCAHHQNQRLADTRIWSLCLYEQCRDVVKSGILYYKPHKRGSYSQKMFILTANGWVLFYNVYDRDSSKQHCNHQKKGALDLAGCYVYSGLDDSKKRKGSNRDSLLRKSARIYKNGLSTDDDSLSCIFSIWKPSLRRYFSTRKHRLSVYHHDKRTNPYGSTWTFLAPSRREKEEWVCALNTVIEHMIRNESR
ncbi:hypothetical protein CU098_013579 [Rhizopus stolonifer]|uniref:PH domain-containing protein n=1 Tax=Rhizopus stolonifer TaxID=4846 RepID=A0A367KUQ2_RHIST|nr:hypothetical protein CU098_013579 [Rhizopus stolonifer]